MSDLILRDYCTQRRCEVAEEQLAEIKRLQKIEAAAQKVIAERSELTRSPLTREPLRSAIQNLRRALEEKI